MRRFEFGARLEPARRPRFMRLHSERRDRARFVPQFDQLISRLNAVVKLRDIGRDFEFHGRHLGETRIAHADRRRDLRALLAPYIDIQARAESDDDVLPVIVS